MVSLENRFQYSLRVGASPKMEAFNNLLANKIITIPTEQSINEADKIYFGLINAVQLNDKSAFENYYNKKNKSNPTKESPSPFINDDFLIFTIIVGIARFKLDKDWIKNIISLRSRNEITLTFENILNENYYSITNLPEVVIMFCQLNNKALLTPELLNNGYNGIVGNVNLFEIRSDFRILCALKSYDLIIELKESPDGSEIKLLSEFNLKFIQRIKGLSWIIQTILLVTLFYFAVELISIKTEVKVFFDKIGTILKITGIIGISQIGNVFPSIKATLYEILLRMFGYPQELIKKLKE